MQQVSIGLIFPQGERSRLTRISQRPLSRSFPLNQAKTNCPLEYTNKIFSNKGPDIKIGKDHEYANHLGEVPKDGERSLQAALGEIKLQGLEFETKISVKTLYRYIDMVFIPGMSNKDLPIKRSKDTKKKKTKPRAARNCKEKSIEERPKEVDGREAPGYWEMDTVVSKKGGSLARVLSIKRMMRRRHPKGTDFGKVSKKTLWETRHG